MRAPRRVLRTGRDALVPGFDAIRAEHDVPVVFDDAVLAEAAAAARRSFSGTDRRDARDVELVTIDPPGSTDLDQAMRLERRGDGYRVFYAIADTAAFVTPGGALDAATHQRVETVYCPDVRVPLHPPVLSEDAASLLPGVDRPAVLWTLDLDAAGEVSTVAVERALVRSREKLDYPAEQARLDSSPGADDRTMLLAEVGTLRAALERARGGVSLGRPEQEVVDGPDGGWTLAYRAPLAIEDHNAQISLMTGMAAATLMIAAGVGILRTMPAAGTDDLTRLRRQARALGVRWEDGQDYGDVLSGLDRSLPGTAAFLAAATSLFRGAAWTAFIGEPPADHLHGAIAAPYAHVTAPLRRLVDRFGLEICLAAHAGTPSPEWVLAALPTIGEEMAVGVRRSASVDRACTDLVEAVVLAPQVGHVFDGVALDADLVQLDTPAVVGRTQGPDLPVGEDVRVRLVSADVERRTVSFTLDD
jgi:exoribonuclease R